MLCWSIPVSAATMRCGNRLVQTGESQYAVRKKCGPPAYRDSFRHYLLPGEAPEAEETLWFYDFGTNRLINVLHFRGDRLTQIDTAGYGFGEDPPRDCNPYQIRVGMTVYELLQTCGEPQDKHATTQWWQVGRYRGSGAYETTRIDRWTYDFGANQFPRIVEISAGVVRAVRSGDRL